MPEDKYLIGDAYTAFEDVAWDLKNDPKEPDCFGIVVGGVGDGKSNFAQAVLYDVDETFSIDKILFEKIEWEILKTKIKRGQGVSFDEGIDWFFARDAMTLDTKDNVKDMTKIRSLGAFILVCIPSIKLLDKYVKMDRPNFIVKVKSPNFKLWSFIVNEEQTEEQAEEKLITLIKNGFNAVPYDLKGKWREVCGKRWDKYREKKERFVRGSKKDKRVLKAEILAEKEKREWPTDREWARINKCAKNTFHKYANMFCPKKYRKKWLDGQWHTHLKGNEIIKKRWAVAVKKRDKNKGKRKKKRK